MMAVELSCSFVFLTNALDSIDTIVVFSLLIKLTVIRSVIFVLTFFFISPTD